MKGLLTKDIHMLLKHKKMLLLMALFIVFVARLGVKYIPGYFILVCFALGDTTIGYDMADKNLAYLMTLPASRKTYVLEKYLLVLFPGFVGMLFFVAVGLVVAWIQDQQVVLSGLVFGCISIFWVGSVLVSVLLPLELMETKKSKILIQVLSCAFGIIWVTLMKNEETLQKLVNYAGKVVKNITITGAFAGGLGIWLVTMTASICWSMWIMAKKEF